jgi:methyl-accepting chemotaxis protein
MFKLFDMLSIKRAGWQSQLSVAYALMALIPLLTFSYLALTYIMPSIATVENVAAVIGINLVISLGGFRLLYATIKDMAKLRDHLSNMADGNLSQKFKLRDGPDVSSITASIQRISEKIIHDNTRLQNLTNRLEKEVEERTVELRRVNTRLETGRTGASRQQHSAVRRSRQIKKLTAGNHQTGTTDRARADGQRHSARYQQRTDAHHGLQRTAPR